MEDQALWELMQSTRIKLEACYRPAIQQLVSDSELSMREWMMLIAGLTFNPENITPSHLLVRGPYTSSEQYLTWLNEAAERGYFTKLSEGEFHLTSKGMDATQEFINLAREALVSADPLHPAESGRLAELLERLILECLDTPPPPDTWSIRLSYKLMPDIDPPLPFIEQALSCLAAYRDDAHLAAWQSSSLSAIALEILTLIWRIQVSSSNEIFRKLSFRGHPRKVYMNALNELGEKGYISGNLQNLELTEDGKNFRDQVEAKTDHYFFSPWSCLTISEKKEITGSLVQF